MNILFLTSEASPFYRSGGCSDVVYGLAKELCLQGHDVRIAVPHYRTGTQATAVTQLLDEFEIQLGVEGEGYSRSATLLKYEGKPVFYFIAQDFYFGRDDYYGYMDDYERFIFFTRTALEMLTLPIFRNLEKDWFPEIIQGFDWITGLIPGWLPKYRAKDKRFDAVRFSLFVHNIRRLGKFGSRALSIAEQENSGIYKQIGERSDQINFLGRGILFADHVVTVDPDYNHKDNPLPESAEPLRKVLEDCLAEGRLKGIPTRIDMEEYDPSLDKALKQNFTYAKIDQRIENKLALQAELGFKQDKNIPLFGMVGRLIPEHGFTLLKTIQKSHAQLGDIQLAILVEPGDMAYQSTVQKWEKNQDQYKPWIKTRFAFDDNLARMIYAGCDIYLIPVKEMQSGIVQLIAMHYGAIPVAHYTGALCKTILNYKPGMELRKQIGKGKGAGFIFNEFSGGAFLGALKMALQVYHNNQNVWRELQLFNMRERFTWDLPAGEYIELYMQMLQIPPQKIPNGEPLALNKEARLLQAIQEIGNLPGIGKRSSSDILKQAARLVRWVLPCDAVYVRGFDKSSRASTPTVGSRQLGILERSLDFSQRKELPNEKLVLNLLMKSTNNPWKHLGDVDREGICQIISGLKNTKIAKDECWKNGWSVPMLAHGRLLGWIDALFTKPLTNKSWIVSSLTLLANSFGLRLDSIRIMEENDQVSAMGLELIDTQSVDDVFKKAYSWVNKLMPDSCSWIYSVKNGVIEPFSNCSTKLNHAISLAQQAQESQQVVYVADWNDAPRGDDHHRMYRSVLAIPIMSTHTTKPTDVDSILMIVSEKQAAFTHDDEQILAHHLSPQIYTALKKARSYEQHDQKRVDQLKKIVKSLIGGGEFNQLLEDVVSTTAEVLESQAASLYLVNKDKEKLEIKAAFGYHRPLLKENIFYSREEKGITCWIWATGKPFKADSLDELHEHPAWAGKTKDFQKREPNAYLGIPLKIVDRTSKKEQVIGVLKFEDRKRPNAIFNDEDARLGEMMANIIATVVYNDQISGRKLTNLSNSLKELSRVLVGGQAREILMSNIVKKINEVVGVDAASLFLADEMREKLVIQAASGYQKKLMEAEHKPSYHWGQGVTGWIASENRAFKADSLEELREKGRGSKDQGTFDHLQERKQPESFYGMPLSVEGESRPIGVLKVERLEHRPFTEEEVLLITMMGNIIAAVVYNVQISEKKLTNLSNGLKELSRVLVGGQAREILMRNIVEKINEVVGVDAATLFLADEKHEKLVIQAASGYQEILMRAEPKPSYLWGQGVTGWIADENKPLKADSLMELREKGRGSNTVGTFDHLQKEKQPKSFYGMPLSVEGESHPIGVLKVERLQRRPFSEEEVLLITMMGNIIAAVVYNVQISEDKLARFSENIRRLSVVLTPGGQNTQEWFQKIVDTISKMFVTNAASLYLVDESNQRLVIAAASGYQKPLMKVKAFYEWGEGVTGKIASGGQAKAADTLAELRKGTGKRGTYDHLQGGNQPNSYYGVPLNVTGEKKPIGVLKFESLHEKFFTDESRLLIDMMANVIATVIYNTRGGEDRIGSILQQMGILSEPINTAPELLRQYANSEDEGIIDQLAKAIALVLETKPAQVIEIEAKTLFEVGAKPALYERIAIWSKKETLQWKFSLFHRVLSISTQLENWEQVLNIAKPWLYIKESSMNTQDFALAAHELIGKVATAIHSDLIEYSSDQSAIWFGSVVDTSNIFGESIKRILVLLQRQGVFDEDNWDRMHSFAQQGLNRPYQVIMLIVWDFNISDRQIDEMKKRLRIHATDVVALSIVDILHILEAPRAHEVFRSSVLRQVTTTSPFITEGAVPDSMFFGREQEIRKIIEYVGAGRSCVIIGGRRIGKTSVLVRLSRVRLPDIGFCTFYHDCSTTPTSEAFLAASIQSLRPRLSSYTSTTIKGLLESPPTEKPFVLLLDEVDFLVRHDRDHDWQLFKRFRALSNSKQAQVVLSGENVLRVARGDENGPLFNIANEMLLGPLEYADVGELVTRSMKQLEIELVNQDAIVRRVYEFSSGHPNVVQRFCNRLIEQLTKQEQQIKQITLDDVDAVVKDPDFIRNDFLETYFSRASVLEQLCALLMATNLKLCKLNSVYKVVREHDIIATLNQIDDALERLVDLRNILKRTSEGYDFAVPAFPRIISGSKRVTDLIDLRREIYITSGDIAPEIAPTELKSEDLWE